MRTNLPVTGVERHLADGEFILSKADLKGNVTYINRTFIEMSGFTEKELMGEPHNILRHPDMPTEAFRDFWSTLKSGKSWSGMVKNRCKNGDHYWVQANASPIWQNGTMTGYMSVRTRPDRRLVDEAEELYRKMRNGETKVTLSEGRVVQPGLKGRFQDLTNVSIKRRMLGVSVLSLLALTAVALIGIKGFGSSAGSASVFASLGVVALLIAYFSQKTYGVVAKPLQKIRQQMVEITNGNMSLLINKDRSDEIGDMADAFKSMFIKLRFDMADTKRTADAAMRMNFALDNVSTPVTVSNEENNLIYMNRSGRALLESIFKSSKIVDSLYGRPLVESLTDEALVAITTGRLEKAQTAQGMVGDKIIRLSTSPVIDQSGIYLGRVCQWVDRTAEIAAEQDVAAIVEAAAAGDFSKRIEVGNKEGYFKSLAVDLNNFVEAVDNALSDVVRVLNSLAKGDLTQTIDREYTGTFLQMKTDANATVAQLKSIVTTISEATDAINGAAKEIASGNVDLSRRTESQAASLEQTASSTEELTNTVKNNADNASQASELARTSSEVADRGGKVVSEVVSTMGAIAESSNKIAEIISVIDGIAFQTNILALNAAVEAARAGEQGRGFAVVAGEVRNLAQRSASAAKEIKELISESVGKVSNGYKLVETAGQTMQEIVSSTQRVASIMNEISSASEEQRNGIMQLSHAITSMDESTQQNAALVEEAAASAQSLEDQANNLSQAVGVFRVDNKSSSRGKSFGQNVERMPLRAVSGEPTPMRSRNTSSKADDGWEEF